MDNAQYEKSKAFKELHQRAGAFVMPNPWDAGSARMLSALGFEALATTSAGLAFSLGKQDGHGKVSSSDTALNVREIVSATYLPVSADLENGYGDSADDCARCIAQAAALGLAGGSIEDATGRPGDPVYAFDLAVARISAAASAAARLPIPFTLTARAENLIYGIPDLNDTIRRLTAFAEAGADVLFAPGLSSREDIIAVVKAVSPKPVSVVMGLANAHFTVNDLGMMGVKRISLGSSLARSAYSSFFNAAREIKEKGSFGFAGNCMSYDEINNLFRN